MGPEGPVDIPGVASQRQHGLRFLVLGIEADDEVVLAGTETQPRTYCEAIVQMLDGENHTNHAQPVLAVGGSTKNIEERIMTILSPNRRFFRGPSLVAVAILFLVAAFVLPSAIVVTARAK